MKIHFKEVGRDKRSWTAESKSPSESWLAKEAKRGAALMSSDVDATLSDSGASGIILVGGWRQVGTFTIESA